MRIRRHASRALSSLSIPTLSAASGGAGGALEAARDMEMSVCGLNQSPWDALPPTPPERSSGRHFQTLSPAGEDKSELLRVSAEIELGDLPAATDALSSLTPAEPAERLPGRRTTRRKKMTWRKKGPIPDEGSMEREMKTEVEAAAAKTFLLPESHSDRRRLNQVWPLVQWRAPVQVTKKKMKKTKKKKRTTQREREDTGGEEKADRKRDNPSSDIYLYYYYGFAPGRGKRKGGAGGAGSLRRRRNEDEDDEDDDDVVVDLGEDCGRDDVIEIKRTGRKPIKSRSLRSLL